jgi:hypothetical protein
VGVVPTGVVLEAMETVETAPTEGVGMVVVAQGEGTVVVERGEGAVVVEQKEQEETTHLHSVHGRLVHACGCTYRLR